MFIQWTNGRSRFQNGFKPWWLCISGGAALIFMGLMIMIFPQILVAFISGTIMLIGFYLLSFGLSMRPSSTEEYGQASNQDVFPHSHHDRGRSVKVEIPRGDNRFDHVFRG